MSDDSEKGNGNRSTNSIIAGPGDHALYIAFKNGSVQIISGLWSKTTSSGNIDGILKIVTDFYMHLNGTAMQSQFRYDTGGGVAVLFFDGIEGIFWHNWKNTPPWSVPNPPIDLRLCTLIFKNCASIGRIPAIYSKAGDTAVGLNHLQTQFELFRRGDPNIAKVGNYRFEYSGAVLALASLESIFLHNVK